MIQRNCAGRKRSWSRAPTHSQTGARRRRAFNTTLRPL